ncbi:MAG: DUF1631 family protein [Proteobacteria bacterium]|nr:DUF1631 family protein [Pseudomonadota bacterium]
MATSDIDKRKSTRYAVKLNALVHPNVGRSWLCTIQDFCGGGMLLTEQDSSRTRRAMPGIKPGEKVGIHFSVPGDKERHFRLEGKIVRVMESGVGINFPSGMDEDAMDALMDHSGGELAKPRPKPAATNQGPRRGLSGAARATGSKLNISNTAAGNRSVGRPTAAATPARPGARDAGGAPAAESSSGTAAKSAEAPAAPQTSSDAFLSGEMNLADSKRMVAALRREILKILPEMNAAFFKYMDSELLELAKNAKSNAEQSEFFAAMSNLEKAKKQVGQDFMKEVIDQVDNPRDLETLLEERRKANEERKAASANKRVKLSLVNTDEFEDWLAVANIVSRSERVYEKYLDELQTRMGHMVDAWAHNEANPLGVSVFSHAFDDAIRSVELSKDVRQKVYSGYESKVIPLFRKLYITTTKLLEDSGLFPDLDEDYVSPAKQAAPAEVPEPVEEEEEIIEQPEPEATIPEPDDDPEDTDDEVEELIDLQDLLKDELQSRREEQKTKAPQRAPEREQAREEDTTQSRPQHPPRPRSIREMPKRPQPRDMGEAISNLYGTVRQLMDDFDGYDDDGDQDYVELDEVEHMLQELQSYKRESGMRLPIRQRLMDGAVADGRQRRLSPQAAEGIEVVESLVDNIEQDELLSEGVKDWVRQLELTLDKVATTRSDFLSKTNPHRSVEVINQLARLGGAETGSVKRHVDQIIQGINENYDQDPSVFDDAYEQLQPLIDRQSRAFTGNVQRAVKASEGQQTLRNAQKAVVTELDKRLAGKQVPEVLMKLLMPGWRNLMVNTHLRQGQESTDWRKHLQALEQLFQYTEEGADPSQSPDYMPPEELMEHISAGLDSISYEPGQRIPLLNSLRKMLTSDDRGASLPKVAIEESIADTLGFTDVGERDAIRQKIIEEMSGDEKWERARERAGLMHVGEWVEFLKQQEEPEIAIVAWISEDQSRLVFVNRRGANSHDLAVEELATMMIEGQVRILEEADIPLTDRASHRMLQDMHNQLTHQATHDELTGLVNRKEFERELERALGVSKRDKKTHVVAYFDLDQFKVVNNTGGHEAGDQLLMEIGGEMRRVVDDGVILARLGGDEYGVLIENSEKEHGLAVLKKIGDVVKAHRFKWRAEQFSLTTSCGWVFVDESTKSVSEILQGADAACIAAKEAGRDRLQEYTAEDSDMGHRRGVMEFVSQIDKALEEDRFVLNCQKIAPLDEKGKEHAHYEVLLTVLDDKGEPMPPQDFIIAAETYNRMGAIDRWVIKNAFEFIASNILKLDDLGAFSINVSGNSLTEPDFMEFVLEQFNQTRLPTSRICFEITETSAIGNLDDVVEFMDKLKIIGVQFSLDDFGTGLSSYSYLRNLPVDFLKIDGIFVKDIKSNPSDYAVVKSINEIGHFMGKKTIAEYVEDDEVMDILREIGVDFAQGYGVEKKRPIVELLSPSR